MDAEFVNAYIQKQKNFINELMAKLLVAETQLEVLEKKIGSQNEQIALYAAELEKHQKKTTKASSSSKDESQGF